MRKLNFVGRAIAAIVCLVGSAAVHAQGVEANAVALPNSDVGAQITREAADLREVMRPEPDADFIDTALVFHNPMRHRTLVWCVARNANGRIVGRGHAIIPARGLRFILASDIADGKDYLGSAQCRARAKVVPSAFVIGTAFSDATANASEGWDGETAIQFPVVVTN